MTQLSVGTKAPEFSLSDQDGNTVSLSDFEGQKLLIYFYPRANTPGCTIQSCSVSDSLSELGKSGVAAVGISPDKPGAQKKFDDKYSLGFPLLADEQTEVAAAFGVWGEKTSGGKKKMGIIRSAFLVDEDGKLIGVWYKVKPDDTVPNVIEILQGS